MRLTHDVHGTTFVLTPLRPRFDAPFAGEFRDAVHDSLADTHTGVIVDLKHVTFIDSSGIGALVNLLKHVGRHRELVLCGLNPTVQKVFKLTRLNAVFTICPDLETAFALHRVDDLAVAV